MHKSLKQECWVFYFTEAETVTESRKWLHKYTQERQVAWSNFSFIYCLKIHLWETSGLIPFLLHILFKNSLMTNRKYQVRRPGFSPWVGKIPWRRERLPTLVFWPREFHGLYSPWGCTESDMAVLEFILHAKIYMLEFIIIKMIC